MAKETFEKKREFSDARHYAATDIERAGLMSYAEASEKLTADYDKFEKQISNVLQKFLKR